MSVYRRNKDLQRCQRWDSKDGAWRDCAFDEPETRVRDPKREGMIVANNCCDFGDAGPLVLWMDDLIADLKRQEQATKEKPC